MDIKCFALDSYPCLHRKYDTRYYAVPYATGALSINHGVQQKASSPLSFSRHIPFLPQPNSSRCHCRTGPRSMAYNYSTRVFSPFLFVSLSLSLTHLNVCLWRTGPPSTAYNYSTYNKEFSLFYSMCLSFSSPSQRIPSIARTTQYGGRWCSC